MALFALAAALSASPAWAHSMHVFVSVEGDTVRGRAYFRGGTPARGIAVTAYAPENEAIGQTTTDDEGRFSFVPKSRSDHRFVVDSGDGHGAEARIAAAQLPDSLPPLDSQATPAAAQAVAAESVAPLPVAATSVEALRADLAQVRQQLDRMENSTRVRDALGGLGYILGLAGVAFYLLARRQTKPL